MKKVSTKVWILVIGLIFALCVAFTAFLYFRGRQAKENQVVGPVAVIYQNGVLVDAVDLGKVEENYTKTYEGEDGAENTAEFSHGQVRMEHASCPDQVCVGMGWQDGSFPDRKSVV